MSHLSQEHVQDLYNRFGELKVLDDIIRHRAADEPQEPMLGYPRSQESVDDYELFDGKQLDRFIDNAVKYFISNGFWPNGRKTVALLAPSNVDYIVSFFALSRLGYTVLALSLRIPPIAIIKLLRETDCSTIVRGHLPQIQANLRKVGRDSSISTVAVPERYHYDRPFTEDLYFQRVYDREEENKRIALIIHSSGSTGLPKPIFLSHKAVLTHPTQGSGLHNFNALPWYHLYGISTSLQAMWMKKTAYLYNTALPLTADNLVSVMKTIRPEAIHCVPYVLGLLAEKPEGIDTLKACQIVTAAGARTPDELGDRLVKEGVKLGVVFGTTEAGLAGDTMRRAKGDDSWNYIRLYTNIREYVHMSPLGDDQYEVVYLKGHPALSSTELNDDPKPGSWHSKDVFTPHPTIPNAWKYVTRIDDRVTLVNGEKVLPLPIEGRLREDELIREAVVVGVDRPIPGLLVFRARDTESLSDEAYLDTIWPSIVDANTRAEAFSQISRGMIKVLPADVEYPQTDKGSIIRAQVYMKFAEDIEELYNKLDSVGEGDLKLDLAVLEEYLVAAFSDTVGVTLPSRDADFFSCGVDSLKAIEMRHMIQKNLALNGQKLPTNIIYEKRNAKELAQYLFALSKGEETAEEDQSVVMRDMIDKYSSFKKHRYVNGVIRTRSQSVFLTGATGAIGAHTLGRLLADSTIDRVYCLVRGEDPLQRVLDSLSERRLEPSEASLAKIVAFEGDLSKDDLGLDAAFLALLQIDVCLIIHIAWPVNFNIPLQSFEPHIAGLHNLLELSLSVRRPEPAQVFFCSSISTAFNTPCPASIPNAPITDSACVSPTGYARSKYVGEHIVWNAARAGARSYVFRIGQIVGDTHKGVWNDKEFLPMMIRSALTLNALPILPDNCSWLPVDVLAASMIELTETLGSLSTPPTGKGGEPSIFYNLVNPQEFSWKDLLEELHASGLDFASVPFDEWLQLLQQSAADGDEARNPAVKLVEYYKLNYSGVKQSEPRGLTFDSHAAQRDSATLRSAPKVVEDGSVQKFLVVWLQRWIMESYKGLVPATMKVPLRMST